MYRLLHRFGTSCNIMPPISSFFWDTLSCLNSLGHLADQILSQNRQTFKHRCCISISYSTVLGLSVLLCFTFLAFGTACLNSQGQMADQPLSQSRQTFQARSSCEEDDEKMMMQMKHDENQHHDPPPLAPDENPSSS